MATRPKVRVMTPRPAAPEADPRGRVDVLLLRVGELLTRRVERVLLGAGVPAVDLWGGADGVQAALSAFCDQQGLTGLNVLAVPSPLQAAERSGLLKRRRGGAR